MLPTVQAIGHVSRAGLYKQISDKGGVVEFTIACSVDNPRSGEVNPVRYFKVEHWVKEGSIVGKLSEGAQVFVVGQWHHEGQFHTIKASRIQIISGD